MKKDSNKKVDTKKCEKCRGRTALVTGYFYYSPDAEPYKNGIEEKAKVASDQVYLSASVCDKCGRVQRINIE